MKVGVEVTIDAPKADVWKVVSDIENAATTISGIEKVEVLERPDRGILGLKWKETRTLFGKTASETMWITEVDEGSYYVTEAHSHGSAYTSKIHLAEEGEGTRLRMDFGAKAESLGAKVMSALLGFMIKSSTRKLLQKDLEDVKAAVESSKP